MADHRKSSSRNRPARKKSRKSAGGSIWRLFSRKTRKTRRAPRQNRFLRLGSRFWPRLASLSLTLLLLGLALLAWFAHDLPSVDRLQTFEKSPGIRIYDPAGELIANYGDVVGSYITYDQLPKNLVNAVLATEDRRFFEHSGMDWWGLARAMWANIRAGGIVQGGSTVTQQLAKNVFLTPDRTVKRKIQELMLSFWLESHFSKQEILEIYLNRVYLGSGNYGIDAATRQYFDKSARELNLQESALLAGLLKAPSRYAPTRDIERARLRAKQVILNMQDAEMLSEQQAVRAISELPDALKFQTVESGSIRYYTDWVVDQLPEYIGHIEDDLQVVTTLDLKLQQAAEAIIAEKMAGEGAAKDVSQAALVAMEPDGAVQAVVGGVNYAESQYNRATQALRQPGSAFKLFVYLAAIEAGYTPNSWVEDKPVRYGSWSPQNYSYEFLGEMPLREAFYRSINTVAAQLAKQVGPGRIVEMARRLGITAPLTPDLTLALGTSEVTLLELTGAFAHIANSGQRLVPYAITQIRQKDGRVLYSRKAGRSGYVVRENVARMMNDLMTGTVELGTGRRAAIGRPVAGKTGTSSDFRDAWFVGFTPQLVTGVWVGNDNNRPMKKVTGGSIPAGIWHDFMQQAMAGKPVVAIPRMFDYDSSSVLDEERMIGPSVPSQVPQETLPWNEGTAPPLRESTQKPTPSLSIFDWFDQRGGE